MSKEVEMIQVTARIVRDNVLADLLEEIGLTVRRNPGYMYIELPVLKKGQGREPDDFSIPHQLESPTLFLTLAEHIKKKDHKLVATVVCGLKGTPLPPFYVCRSIPKNGINGLFSVPGAAVTVAMKRYMDYVTIRSHVLTASGLIASVKTELIFEGPLKKMTHDYRMYREAIKAARRKLRCKRDCCHVHFMTEKKKEGGAK